MRVSGIGLLLVAGLAVSVARADDVKSGPQASGRIGGAFQVKAFSGENKGRQLCYV